MKMQNCPVSENKIEKISFNIFWKYVLIIDLVEELYIFLVIMFFNFLLHQNNTSNNHHFIALKMNQNGNYKLIPWGEIGIKITHDEEVFKIQMTRKCHFTRNIRQLTYLMYVTINLNFLKISFNRSDREPITL